MEIGYITPTIPYPPDEGGKIVAYNRLEELAERGHNIYLFCISSEPPSDSVLTTLESICAQVFFEHRDQSVSHILQQPALPYPIVTRHTKALKTKLKQTVKFTPLDVVVAEHTHVSPYLNSLSVPTCLSIHNVEYLSLLSSARSLFPRPASLAYTFDSARMWIFENKLFESKAPDACLFLSKKEQRIASTKFPDNQDKFVHIPAGVKMQPLSKVVPNSEGDDPTLIFTGTMRYPPNVEAVTWFVNDVLPKIHKRHSSVEFQIVGKDPTDEVQQLEQADGVTVTGRVDSTKPYLLSADVSVIPLHQATGTQLKLLESLAVGNPTVATSLAVEGAEVKSGKHVVVADKSREFASEVCHLLDNTEAATELGLRGRDLVEQEYSVQACVSKLESTLMNLIEDSV